MLFEKPNIKILASLDVIGLIVVAISVSVVLTYGACAIYGIAGGFGFSETITFLDLINGMAHIATEAKSQLEKMISVIGKVKTGNDTCLYDLNKSLTLLSNLAVNFDELFKAMEEDIQKAIVRMQWQDMFFNCLRNMLLGINLVAILKNETSISDSVLKNAIAEAKAASEEERVRLVFKDYVFANNLINHPDIQPEFSLKNRIDSLDQFVSYYLNSHNLNDLMHGLISKIDIRVHAPLLAVADPNEWALKNIA